MVAEIWKQMSNFENYEISNLGNLRNFKTKKHLSLKPNKYGYITISIADNNRKRKSCRIHRLVGKAFLPNPDNLPTIDHINRNRADNRLENLRWASYKEQAKNSVPTKPRKQIEAIDMENEEWRKMTNGLYVSNYGRIKDTNNMLRVLSNSPNYHRVKINYKRHTVHKLVAEYFLKNPNNYKYICHIDGNKKNNKVSNLKWATKSECMKNVMDLGIVKCRTKIVQKDVDENTIKIYDSILKATKECNINLSSLQRIITKNDPNKIFKNYIWLKYNEL